jgi:hypothetical protein
MFIYKGKLHSGFTDYFCHFLVLFFIKIHHDKKKMLENVTGGVAPCNLFYEMSGRESNFEN